MHGLAVVVIGLVIGVVIALVAIRLNEGEWKWPGSP